MRDENTELRRRAAETSILETSLKKAEAKVGTLEEKVINDLEVSVAQFMYDAHIHRWKRSFKNA